MSDDYVSEPLPDGTRWAVVPRPKGDGWSWWVMRRGDLLGSGVEPTARAASDAAAASAIARRVEPVVEPSAETLF